MAGLVPFAPRDSRIADLILEQGRIGAQRAQHVGQIQGQAWSDVGNRIATSLSDLVRQRQQRPILEQEAKARDLEIQAKQGAVDAQQRAAQDVTALDTAAQATGEMDPAKIEAALPGHLRLQFRKTWNDAEAAKQQLAESRAKANEALNDHIGAMAYAAKLTGVHQKPDAVMDLLKDADEQGLPDAKMLAVRLRSDPSQAPQIVDFLIGRSNAQREYAMKQGALDSAAADRTADNARQAAAGVATAADRAADNARQDQQLAATVANQQTMARIAQQNANTSTQRANAANTALDVSSDVRTTLSGQKYIDLGDYQTPTERSKASAEAKRLGVTAVPKEVGMSLQAGDTARQNISAMMAQIESKLPKDAQGRVIAGPANRLRQYFQSDADLAAFNSWRAGAIQAVQALVERGMGFRLNQAEINMIMQNDMPQITDTVQTARQRTANVLKLLDNKEKAALTKDRSALATTDAAAKAQALIDKYSR